MDSKNFNLLDKFIAAYRLFRVNKYIEKGDMVLDFGCGARSYLLEFNQDKIKKGVGLDYDVENQKFNKIEYLTFKFKDRLVFDKEYFDKIFLLAVLEHIESKQVKALFREFKRILKPGGKIVLTTPTPKSKSVLEWLAFRLKLISEKEIKDHKKYYSKKDILEIAKNLNLKVTIYRLFQCGLNSYAVLEKVN